MSGALYSSRTRALLTLIGVSVGLANVWRFPYMMGQHGGSAFLLLYLGFTFLIAIPALSCEWALGRAVRGGPLKAYPKAFGQRFGTGLAVFLLVGILAALSYYTLVVGNVFFTAGFALVHGFGDGGVDVFHAQLSQPGLQYGVAFAVLLLGLWVIHRGLHRGIEAISAWIVPLFAVVIAYLVFHSLSQADARAELASFLRPDFSAIGSQEVFAALGQSCFSVGLGGTFMLLYGSYIKDGEGLMGDAAITCVGDASAAVIAGLFIVPSVLVFGLDMAAGPALVFNTLPELFARMPGGYLAGGAFLAALSLVAFLSVIAALNVVFDALASRLQSRNRALLITGLCVAGLMLPNALYPALIGILDLFVGSGMQIFGSAMAAIAVLWGLGRYTPVARLLGNAGANPPALLILWMRWVVPGALLVILVSYIYSSVQA